MHCILLILLSSTVYSWLDLAALYSKRDQAALYTAEDICSSNLTAEGYTVAALYAAVELADIVIPFGGSNRIMHRIVQWWPVQCCTVLYNTL